MKIILSLVLLSMTLLVSGCGDDSSEGRYDSFTECKLREYQKCRNAKCELAAYAYCTNEYDQTKNECIQDWISSGRTNATARELCKYTK
jgi:hypothetical protein